MPCMCHYDPPEASKRLLKEYCQAIVDEVKRLRDIGDPLGCNIEDIHELINHLYEPKICKERKDKD